jgi:hypothetical protein
MGRFDRDRDAALLLRTACATSTDGEAQHRIGGNGRNAGIASSICLPRAASAFPTYLPRSRHSAFGQSQP